MKSTLKAKNIPTVFIIFGATGDLMSRKIIPALFHLHTKGKLPKLLRIIGFSRRDLTDAAFHSFITDNLKKHIPPDTLNQSTLDSFVRLFSYQRGNFEHNDDYKTLAETLGHIDGAWRACSNKLFYLAVPPSYYKAMFEHLASSGLTIPCGPDEGWTRVIVEKPFGKDLDTAQKLDGLLGKLFREEQIYRIDHYLGKEMLQNILSFRFNNNLFQNVWNGQYIEKVEVRLFEKIGIEARGDFYDGIGALRDVGQNHLLQMLALIAMDQPKSFEADKVRVKRAEVLKTLEPYSESEIKERTFRGQYKGYLQTPAVSQGSSTETYFKVVAYLNSSSWKNIPFILESGKMLSQKKEIIVTFRHTTPCLCPPGVHYKNRIIFSLEPTEKISIEFWAKKPGFTFEMEKEALDFFYKKAHRKNEYAEGYEKLLLDCILGNQLLFISTDEVRATWRFIDSIVTAWQENIVPLHTYKPNSNEVFTLSKYLE